MTMFYILILRSVHIAAGILIDNASFAESCGTSQQGVLLPVSGFDAVQANAPEANVLLRFSKLPCAARSAKVP